MDELQVVAAELENVPTAQGVQLDTPVEEEYVSEEQLEQLDDKGTE